MTSKRLLFRSEAREKVLHGAQALADAVRVTLGPKSKSVLVERKFGLSYGRILVYLIKDLLHRKAPSRRSGSPTTRAV